MESTKLHKIQKSTAKRFGKGFTIERDTYMAKEPSTFLVSGTH
ncbi:hypothetical protein [Caldifermentibacillus hisashii]